MEHKTVAIAYVPVLHKGYLSFLEFLEEKAVETLYLISDEILESHEDLDYINRKDRLRAVPHEVMKNILKENTKLHIKSLTLSSILALHESRTRIIAPKEDINEFIVETYFGGHQVQYENIFLRWNRDNLGQDTVPKSDTVPLTEFQTMVFGKVVSEAEKSADWWRQVGAALVKDGAMVRLAHNEHMPEKELPNIIGDTRSIFKKGVNIEYVTTAHAEASVIGEAARKGISTEGAELFTTDFPCPYCARLIVKSGIKKIYFRNGYDVLGGNDFFKEVGIEVFRVE